jgi:hypothetical protein
VRLAPGPHLAAGWAVARADWRERTRRASFLAAMGGAVYFGYLVAAGYVSLTVENQRGVLNSAWVGTLTALALGVLLPLFGFYLVKNTLEHDRATGVGEMLAATPLSRGAYVAGKAASNFCYLAALAAVPAAAALLLQAIAGEERRLDLGALLFPLFWLMLPPLALAAALAVLFEAVRWLRGALGNLIFFALWNVLLVLGAQGMGAFGFDLAGLRLVHDSLFQHLTGRVPADFGGRFALQVGPRARAVSGTFRWPGLDWSAALGVHAAVALVAAAAVILAAALLFDRFDPARQGERAAGRREKREARRAGRAERARAERVERKESGRSGENGDAQRTGENAEAGRTGENGEVGRGGEKVAPGRRQWLPHISFGTSWAGLAAAELRLMIGGRSRWWWLVAAGLLAAGFAAPLAAIRAGVLPAAWLWPLALWSGMGAREARHGTGALVFCSPRPAAAHALAIWAAGALVAAVAGAGPGVRLLAAGDGAGLLSWAAACAFIPSLALALGAWSGGSRLFEVIYLLLWYVGPLNRVREVDFMGVTPGARAGGLGWIYLGLAVLLLLAAVGGRVRQARS